MVKAANFRWSDIKIYALYCENTTRIFSYVKQRPPLAFYGLWYLSALHNTYHKLNYFGVVKKFWRKSFFFYFLICCLSTFHLSWKPLYVIRQKEKRENIIWLFYIFIFCLKEKR